MAGYVDDAADVLERQLREHLGCARTGWINQELVEPLFHPLLVRQVAGQIGGMKLDVRNPVALRVVPGARYQTGVAFHAHDLPCSPGKGQGEIAQTAEQVEHTILRLWIEQLQRAGDHFLIQPGIDLDEIERAESELQVVFWNGKAQFDLLRPERMHRFDSTRLQEQGETTVLGKRQQPFQVLAA